MIVQMRLFLHVFCYLFFMFSLYFKANQKEKPAIGALLSIFLISMFFWAVFKQNGTALTRWANYYTDRSVPASVEKPLEDIYMVDGKDFKDKEVSVYDDQYQTQKMKKENSKNTKERYLFQKY